MRYAFVLIAVLFGPHMMFMYAGASTLAVIVLMYQTNWMFVPCIVAAVIFWHGGMSGIRGVLHVAHYRAFYLAATGKVTLTMDRQMLKVEYLGGERPL